MTKRFTNVAQIAPADGWTALYGSADAEGEETVDAREPVAVWALLAPERGRAEVVGLVPDNDISRGLRRADDWSNFLRYARRDSAGPV